MCSPASRPGWSISSGRHCRRDSSARDRGAISVSLIGCYLGMSFLRCLLFHENCMVTIKTVLNHLRKLVNDLADDLLVRYQRCQDRSRVAGPSPRFRGGRARLSNPGCRTNVDGHPGFATSMSVSLHRFGTDPDYENWRTDLLGLKKFLPAFRISDEKTGNQKFGPDATDVFTAIDAEMTARLVQRVAPIQIGKVLASVSERSTTPLFGSGLIDAIPDAVIEAAARAAGGLESVSEDPWPRQPSCGRKNRPLRLERPDGEARGFRIDRVRRRAGAGGARSSSSTGPALQRQKGCGPRPVGTRRCPDRLDGPARFALSR